MSDIEIGIREALRTFGSYTGEFIVLIVLIALIIPLSSMITVKPQATSFLTDIERAVNDLRVSGRLEVDEFEEALDDSYVYQNGSSICVQPVSRKLELKIPVPFYGVIEVPIAEMKADPICREIGLDALIGEGRYSGKVSVHIYVKEGKLVIELRGGR